MEYGRLLKKYKTILIVSLLLLLTLGSRLLYFSDETHRAWWLWDDTFYINVANNIINGNGFNLSILEYHQAITKSADGVITYKYDMWDEAGRPYYFCGAFYPLFLAGVFKVFSVHAPNWLFAGIVADLIIGLILIVVFYFFVRKLFNSIKIAVISSVLLIFLPHVHWFSLRILPYIFLLLFVIVAFYFVINAKKHWHWLIIGVLCALAHLTHSSGILLIISLFIYCLYKRDYKNTLILVGTYILLMMPWMIRNQLLFGDISLGLGIPLPNLAKVFGIHYGYYAYDAIGSISKISLNIYSVFVSGVWEFQRIYRMLAVIVVMVVLGTWGVYKAGYKKLMPLLIFIGVSITGYVYLSCQTASAETKYLLPAIAFLIPLAVYGFDALVSSFKSKILYGIFLTLIIGLSVWTFFNFGTYINENFNEPMVLKTEEEQFHDWVREQDIPKDSVVLSNAPHVFYLGTGLRVIYFYSQGVDYDAVKKIIDKYGVDYISIYEYKNHPSYDIVKLDNIENELNCEEMYNDGLDLFFKVN